MNMTTGHSSAPVIDIEQLKSLAQKLRYESDFLEAKIANFMIDEGFNPYKGCLIFLPADMKSQQISGADFVRYSELAQTAILVNPAKVGLNYLSGELFP